MTQNIEKMLMEVSIPGSGGVFILPSLVDLDEFLGLEYLFEGGIGGTGYTQEEYWVDKSYKVLH